MPAIRRHEARESPRARVAAGARHDEPATPGALVLSTRLHPFPPPKCVDVALPLLARGRRPGNRYAFTAPPWCGPRGPESGGGRAPPALPRLHVIRVTPPPSPRALRPTSGASARYRPHGRGAASSLCPPSADRCGRMFSWGITLALAGPLGIWGGLVRVSAGRSGPVTRGSPGEPVSPCARDGSSYGGCVGGAFGGGGD